MKTIDEVVEQTTGEEVSSHEHKTLSRRMFVEAAALAGEKVKARIAGKTVVKLIVVPGKLVNLVVR